MMSEFEVFIFTPTIKAPLHLSYFELKLSSAVLLDKCISAKTERRSIKEHFWFHLRPQEQRGAGLKDVETSTTQPGSGVMETTNQEEHRGSD